jgi:dipeptidyl aminopeptidase/acylaminoacyl peptidase
MCFKKSLCLILFLTTFPIWGSANIADELLIQKRQFSGFRLSPDGTHLAFLGPVQEGYRNIYVLNLDGKGAKLITGEKANVSGFLWVNNERIVFTIDGSNRVYNGLYAINRDGTGKRVLIEPVSISRESAFSGIGLWQRVYSRLRKDRDHILIYDENSRRRKFPDLVKLDVYTGRTYRHFKNRGDFRSYTSDVNGVVRFGYTFEEDGTSEVFYRADGDHEFERLHTFKEDHTSYSVVDVRENSAYVLTNHLDNTASLYKLDLQSRQYEKVYSDPVYDMSDFTGGVNTISSRKSGRLLGISYEGAKPKTMWLYPQLEALQAQLDEAYPETVNQIISIDNSMTNFVVASFSDRQPYIYRLLKTNPLSVVELQSSKPWIDPDSLPGTRPVSFNARDGMKIHGYLTLPMDYTEGERVPMLVMPHGGPWARDVWGFRSYLDTMRILPALHGWAVLEVNFRGSTGYGKDHLTASYKNADRMNHDVEDGVLWAVDQGYADKDHLGIMGASWGGYATMWGVTMTPDLYRFGVNIFGVVDMPKQINWYRLRTKWSGMRDEGYEVWGRRIGNPDIKEDLAKLEDWSPINSIDRIKADLLIYHGTQDVNVDIAQSRLLRSELDRAGIEFHWISKANEHHSIQNDSNRLELYNEIVKLLNKHGK